MTLSINKTLHGIVQVGGSGKTHLTSRIGDAARRYFTLYADHRSLYNWGEYDLFKKVIVSEDLHGLEESIVRAPGIYQQSGAAELVTVKDKKATRAARKRSKASSAAFLRPPKARLMRTI